MVSLDLKTATIVEMSQLLERRQLSPIELVEATLDRIAALDPQLNAYTTVTSEYALERARQAEREMAQGNYLGPLHGIPYSLKDLIDTKGIRTTYGYRSHQDYVPQHSATVHSRLEEVGAILVGKTDCHFHLGGVPVKCFNPWDLSRSPGRSSSGSGVSLGASMSLAAIGSDTGGSIRLPAAWSGVVGLRATFGLISRHNTLTPDWSYDTVGPMAKTVKDTAIILQAVAGHDPNDPVSLQDPVPDYCRGLGEGIKGVRVGILEEVDRENCTEEVGAAVRKAIAALEELGATVMEVSIPSAGEAPRAYEVICGAESGVIYSEVFPKERLDNIDASTQKYLERARDYTMKQYLQAQRMATIIRQDVDRVFKGVDVVVSPTCLIPPMLISEVLNSDLEAPTNVHTQERSPRAVVLHKATTIASIAGLPALSVPCGFAHGSLPIGLQLMGRRLEEPLLFRVGYAYEQATEWHLRHPPIG